MKKHRTKAPGGYLQLLSVFRNSLAAPRSTKVVSLPLTKAPVSMLMRWRCKSVVVEIDRQGDRARNQHRRRALVGVSVRRPHLGMVSDESTFLPAVLAPEGRASPISVHLLRACFPLDVRMDLWPAFLGVRREGLCRV